VNDEGIRGCAGTSLHPGDKPFEPRLQDEPQGGASALERSTRSGHRSLGRCWQSGEIVAQSRQDDDLLVCVCDILPRFALVFASGLRSNLCAGLLWDSSVHVEQKTGARSRMLVALWACQGLAACELKSNMYLNAMHGFLVPRPNGPSVFALRPRSRFVCGYPSKATRYIQHSCDNGEGGLPRCSNLCSLRGLRPRGMAACPDVRFFTLMISE